MKKAILFVDDERQILKSINRLFMDSEYDVFLADNGEEALQILEREKIDMIISDMRMPNMDGYQLLKKVKEKHPLVLRLVLSGYAEEKVVFKALRNNLAKFYLLKPWNNRKFIQIIDQVFQIESMIKDETILAIINNLEDIPTIPTLYHKLCSLIEQDADIKAITKVIEEDPAVASKILHIANSAFYGVKTGSINQAILYLGLTNIKSIVLTTSVFNSLKMDSPSLDKDLLWKHSCICNKMVSLFYKNLLGKNLLDTYMSAGLLHDIGRIALFNNFGEKYRNVLKIMNDHGGISIIEAEREIMSISHQEIGAYLLNWWELPQPIVESALFHHNPLDEIIIYKELVCVVHIADCYSWMLLGKDKLSYLSKNSFEFLGVSEESFRKLVSEMKME